MDGWTLPLTILAAQGVLGGFDVLYNHEYLERLPRRAEASFEVRLHGLREALYPLVFAGLAWFRWEGTFALVLGLILVAELLLTTWDSIEEDRIRKVAPSERATHIALSLLAGAFYVTLAPLLIEAWRQPTALLRVDHGALSWLLSFLALTSLAWAVRDLAASVRLAARAR
jgi:hypothetical protein